MFSEAPPKDMWHPPQVLEFAGLLGVALAIGLMCGFLLADIAGTMGAVFSGDSLIAAGFVVMVFLLPSVLAFILGSKLRRQRGLTSRPAQTWKVRLCLATFLAALVLAAVQGVPTA